MQPRFHKRWYVYKNLNVLRPHEGYNKKSSGDILLKCSQNKKEGDKIV